MVKKFLHCFLTLREIGHPSYSSPWWADSSPFVSTEKLDSPLDEHGLTWEYVAGRETSDVKYLCCKVGVDTSRKVCLFYNSVVISCCYCIMCTCEIKPSDTFTQLEILEQELNNWRRKLAELHAQYDWLLFLSVPKVLKIYSLLRQRKPSAFQITSDISFLFSNDPTAMEAVKNAVEVMPSLKCV